MEKYLSSSPLSAGFIMKWECRERSQTDQVEEKWRLLIFTSFHLWWQSEVWSQILNTEWSQVPKTTLSWAVATVVSHPRAVWDSNKIHVGWCSLLLSFLNVMYCRQAGSVHERVSARAQKSLWILTASAHCFPGSVYPSCSSFVVVQPDTLPALWGRAKGIVCSDFICVANPEWKWCTGEGAGAKAMVGISSQCRRRLYHSATTINARLQRPSHADIQR